MAEFEFFQFPPSIPNILKDLKTKPSVQWENKGKKNALQLFRFVSSTVPAYKALLKEHGLQNNQIKSIKDFARLPIIDKDSYTKKYPYLDLFPKRDLSRITTFSATSGSTGEPFYFPRGEQQDAQYEYVAELFLKNQFEIDKKTTLGIIGFGLGIWIGGMFTYKIFNKLAQKGYKISLIPVGPNKSLYLESIKRFGHLYDQIILMGYPPFIKDIIDEAPDYGIKWKDYKIKILTATEHFSEEFRKYLAQKTFLQNSLTDVINIYGTVELGTMAHETAVTNLIRRIAVQKSKVFKELFPHAHRLPTLAQYHPSLVYFEEVEGEVIASGFGSSIPLIRYRFPDRGGVISFETMLTKLKKAGVDLNKVARDAKTEKTIWKLPFVYVYERSDYATTLFGINIYCEYIRVALTDRTLKKYVTGKLTMITKTDKNQDQFLEINVELRKNTRANKLLIKTIQSSIVRILMRRSTEYHYLYNNDPEKYRSKLTPVILLWTYEHPEHFQIGTKQKWVKK